jgi:nucleotide-binding universal stress UspA family protein
MVELARDEAEECAMSEGSVLVAVGSAQDADEVVAWGAREASLRGCSLRLVHAYVAPAADPGQRRSSSAAARRAYREPATFLAAQRSLARQLVPDLPVDVVARGGGRIEVLLQEALDAQLLVVGAGLGWRTDESSGTVAVQLASHANVPVLVVRRGRGRARQPRPRLVVGVSGATGTADLLTTAFQEAALRKLDVVAMHAGSGGRADNAARLLAAAVAGWSSSHPALKVEPELSGETAAAALVHASEESELLVIGVRGSGGFEGLRLGSACDAAIRYAACPVLVDPGPSLGRTQPIKEATRP